MGEGVTDFLTGNSKVLQKEKASFALLGAKWNNSVNTGSFNWNVNNVSGNRNRNISRQLVNAKIIMCKHLCPTSW